MRRHVFPTAPSPTVTHLINFVAAAAAAAAFIFQENYVVLSSSSFSVMEWLLYMEREGGGVLKGKQQNFRRAFEKDLWITLI
jgi:hypothetical protein